MWLYEMPVSAAETIQRTKSGEELEFPEKKISKRCKKIIVDVKAVICRNE